MVPEVTSSIKHILPSKDLRDHVREYQVFRFVFEKAILPPIKFHAPRPEHCITFYLRDTQRFSFVNSTEIINYPSCTVNGLYTVPLNRYGGTDFWAIKVVLKPSTLFRIVKFSISDITNQYIDAEDIWGSQVRALCNHLQNLDDLDKIICVIEMFLRQLLDDRTKSKHPIDEVADALISCDTVMRLDSLSKQSCLSLRQFIRKFDERIGVSAKTFLRIIRFDRAFRMKNSNQDLDWYSVALRCDFYDYQHLVNDFKKFTNFSPPAFYELEKKSPERTFGLFES